MMLRINIQINVFSITPLEKHFFLNKKVVGNVRQSNDFMDHIHLIRGPSCSWSYGNRIYNYLCNQCLPLKFEFEIPIHGKVYSFCDKLCQWLATGRWFSTGTPVSYTNKTHRHNITEILLKMVLNTINLNQTITLLSPLEKH
jgi:hypothetical protein